MWGALTGRSVAAKRTTRLLAAAAFVLAVILVPSARAADGTWERAWGKDVVSGGGTGFEICTVATTCKQGVGGGGLGGELAIPTDVATDSAGNVYVVDSLTDRVQKFDAAGNWERAWGKDVVAGGGTGFEVCTVAANCKVGVAGGLGGEFDEPGGLATNASGAVYVSDNNNQRIQVFDAAGNWQRAWGRDVVTGGGTGFEICTDAATCKAGTAGGLGGELSNPGGLATDAGGNVYVADTNNQRIQKFEPDGDFERTWGRNVDAGGIDVFEICSVAANCQAGTSGAGAGALATPTGVGVGAVGDVYVADRNNNRVQKFDALGSWQRAWGRDVAVGGGTGFEICTDIAACKQGVAGGLGGEFNLPRDVTADPAGAIYVTEEMNHRIQRFDTSGNWQRAWGKDVDTAPGTGFEICILASNCQSGAFGGFGGELNTPRGIAADTGGAVYAAEAGNHRIQRFGEPFQPPPPPPDGVADDGDINPPETTIIEKPKDKTRKKLATFAFTSSKPGSTFTCVLDGKEQFKPCTSPISVKVRKGRHTFSVTTTDSAGNVDPTPATDSWKVKKKRK